jgi:hypothetical protein
VCSNADGSSTSKGSYLYAERSGRAAIRALCKLGLFIDYGRIITGIFAAQQVSLVVNLRAGSQKGCQSAGHIATSHPLSTQRSIVINQSPPTTTNWSNRSHLTKFVHLCLLHDMRWRATPTRVVPRSCYPPDLKSRRTSVCHGMRWARGAACPGASLLETC